MTITDIFIKRPVLAVVVNLLIILAGVQAIRTLNVRQYPRNQNAVITIKTAYVGAGADLVRGFITTPIERAVAAADGIDYIESQSAQGVSTINARLKLNFSPTQALAEISSKVDQVRGDLPPESEVPILSIETADSQFASAYLSFSSDLLEQNEITDYLVRNVQPRLSAIEGVQRADLLGGRTFAMRLWLKPDRMAALGVSPSQVRQALEANHYLSAVGSTRGALMQVNLTANTDMRSIAEFKRLVIREENGTLVRLEDIADVVLGAEDYDAEVRFSGETAVFMGVWVLPNANSLDVIKKVRVEMDNIRKDLPTGMNAGIGYDATAYINDAINEVVITLSETLLIVMVVIFLFLGTVRSVLIPVTAIPVSLIGAVFVMQVFGFTLNLLTLLAVVLSVGLVVDDAIVVVENIERHLREGKQPMDAALAGARELVTPIISMTVTLAAVYAPIGLQEGLTGTLFREFAFTLAGAVLISGVVALTLSPVMSSRLLDAELEHHWLPAHINAVFERLKNIYARWLDRSLSSRPAVYTLWAALFMLAVVFFQQSPQELAPTEDQGVIFGIVSTPSNSTLEQTAHFTHQANDIFSGTPEMDHTFQITMPSSGFGGMIVKPWGERKRTVFEIMPELQMKLHAIPGIQMFPVLPPALPGGGQFPVEFVITSTAETEQILPFANQLAQKAAESHLFAFPPIVDVKMDLPQTEIRIDRDKAADLGLSLHQIGGDLSAAVGAQFVNRFNISGRSYKIIPQIKRSSRLTPEQLQDLQIAGPAGQLIPLSTVATLQDTVQPRSLNRFQQLNSVKLSGVAICPLNQALTFLEKEADAMLPKGYGLDYTGESRQLRNEGNSKFLTTFALSIAIIFLVLSAQFNSFRDPFIILFGSVPLAMFGALLFTFLKMPNPEIPFWTSGWTTTLNIYSKIGLVTLVGLISKNGILIVEFANQLQKTGLQKVAAVRQACLTRLRPILMTSVATVAGHFPLTLVTGAGAEARNSIGLVLVGGMAIGTFFTLFIIPSLYMLLAKNHQENRG